jgi:hypothetical protein
MNDTDARSAVLSALTTEHFVLQNANSSTYAEASARSSLYVMALSSSLVAMGFVSGSRDVLVPFAATVLPAVFLLGLFTTVRLVETVLESVHYLTGIARIRGHYRTLGPDAERLFASHHGRWPEVESPAQRLGPMMSLFGTTASMIAAINNVVAGAAVAVLVHAWWPALATIVPVGTGIALALALTVAFYRYQRWRIYEYDVRTRGGG